MATLGRVFGVAILAGLLYLLAHLGFVVFGHGHHAYKLPLCISIAVAALVMGLLWLFRMWQDLFRNDIKGILSFVVLAVVPIVVIVLL